MKYVTLLFFMICSHAMASLPDGLYSIKGQHKVRGPYEGELEVRQQEVTRIITYQKFKFQKLNVQEVWTGELNGTSATYSLRKADYIVRLSDLVRSPEDFKNYLLTTMNYVNFAATGEYKEKIHYIGPAHSPLWRNERENLLARGDKIPAWLKPFIKISTSRSGFDKDPYVQSFKERTEFKEISPYIVFDPTDYEFYQKNPKTLRVVNKVLDPISMTEAISRRHAYAYSLKEKADIYEQNMQEKHLPPESGIIITTRQDKLEPDFSGGLWSGLYAGSQAMRYISTQDPQALDNFKKVLKGMYTLIDITGNPKHFARSIAPYDPSFTNQGYKEHLWTRGEGQYSHLMFLLEGNNDMFKGLTHSLMWATYIIPESDVETWSMMRKMASQMLGLKIIKDKKQNLPSVVGLAAIILKDKDLEKDFRRLFKKPTIMLSGFSFDTTFYVRGSADWSGINLGVTGAITEIMVADKIGALAISKQLSQRLLDSWETYQPSRRALVTVATQAFAHKRGIRSKHEVEWKEGLNQAMWTLRSVPAFRPTEHIEIDHSLRPDWCLSPVPRLFWKGYKGTPPPSSYFYQGLYDYPIFESDIYQSNYLWKSGAFGFKGVSQEDVEHSGADYLYLYWLSQYAQMDWD